MGLGPSSVRGLGSAPPPCPRAAGERGPLIEYYGRESTWRHRGEPRHVHKNPSWRAVEGNLV